MAEHAAFALTGLISRGGLSNWVFFFFPDQLVMIDVGVAPAIKAGVQAGSLGELGVAGEIALEMITYGPQTDSKQALHAWHTRLREKAKNVIETNNDQIRAIELHMKMLSHELFVTRADGVKKKFGVMNRKEAATLAEPLKRRFGSKFKISKTSAFQFIERYTPFLAK